MRLNIFLTCTNCKKKHQNYRTDRSKDPQNNKKLSLKKYCKFCQGTQVHKEEIVKGTKNK